ncbi:protein of unknown function [Candidatus Hydrogenisulfobacillus filiaventi]|uniref:Uncharacterized protein n=1 Tax=Candidatus Hydrogenisulfobacillus filiaventi TaxID=2707344 RepID=A0A6F8ZD98_9FIRM|nr:protein of unknown function [Candidatus Hydrogenisulfobacillus filiaventi]
MSESITAILGLAQETIEHVTQQADRWIVTVQPPAPGPALQPLAG